MTLTKWDVIANDDFRGGVVDGVLARNLADGDGGVIHHHCYRDLINVAIIFAYGELPVICDVSMLDMGVRLPIDTRQPHVHAWLRRLGLSNKVSTVSLVLSRKGRQQAVLCDDLRTAGLLVGAVATNLVIRAAGDVHLAYKRWLGSDDVARAASAYDSLYVTLSSRRLLYTLTT